MDTYGKVYSPIFICLYNMYKQTKILKAYPLAIDAQWYNYVALINLI